MRLIKNESEWFETEMKVKEAMTRMPFGVGPGVSIFDARKVMRDRGVRHLPVLKDGELAGIISERDIRTAETFHGPGYLTVGDAMAAPPYSVDPDETLYEVLTQMIERRIGSVLVTNRQGTLIGIFTAFDALHLLRSLVILGSRDADFNQSEHDVARAA